MNLLVLDAGAFIAFERGDISVRRMLEAALRIGAPVVTTAPVISQVWRNGSRQAELSRFLRAVRVDSPDAREAKLAGELCGQAGTNDVVDALVALQALNGSVLLTSDVEDLRHLMAVLGRKVEIQRS